MYAVDLIYAEMFGAFFKMLILITEMAIHVHVLEEMHVVCVNYSNAPKE